MATPSLAMIPSAIADSKVYSVLPNNGEGDFIFDRASTATRIGSNGLIQTVATDIPRLNYDISNGVVQSCPSLLLEPASTNLITYSQDFSQWDKNSGTTVTINNAVSPDGTQNATSIVSAGTGSRVGLNVSITSGTTYTLSVYLKNNGGNTSVSIGSHGTTQLETITINNEWNRYTTTFTASSSTTSSIRIISSGSDINLYAFGSQLEALSYATSYIPTNGSSQTRAAETCNDAGIASTFNSTEGVLYIEAKSTYDSSNSRRISISDGTINNRVSFEFDETTENTIKGFVSSGGATQATLTHSAIDLSEYNKMAIKYKANDFSLFINGQEVDVDATGSAPIGLDSLQLQGGANTNYMYGNVKDIRVYNEALTDAQLQTLTS